ncbi:O-methyltransferase [Natronorubrum halophilum]|uniref:O-methyltransferase n=1 Tax=Natronorubrum halophilum TaxID=1702106 RepID=UPI0010C1F9B5|nr:O-methyltransferase [Natronorubrum halophilum]
MTEPFLGEHVPNDVTRFSERIRPESTPVLSEMEAYAHREGFPIVGPDVGAWLCQLARINDATRVFEFGSGYGYSACWFARALPDDGEIVLTEQDAENLDRAESYLERLDAADLAAVEVGDAVDIASRYDGRFDIALIDIEKYQYVDAFEEIRDSIPPGGTIVADNTMSAGRDVPDDTVDFDALLSVLTSEIDDLRRTSLPEETRRHTQGIIDYLTHIREQSAFETTLLPLGDGVTVTTRLR